MEKKLSSLAMSSPARPFATQGRCAFPSRCCSYRLVDLVAHIKDHDGSVVALNGEQSGVLRMKVKAHDARLCGKGVPGGCGLREKYTMPGALAHKA